MKAIALISGGLDSLLAARIVKEQGTEVIPLNFEIPFCHIKGHSYNGEDLSSFVRLSLGEDLRRVDIGSDFLRLISGPRYGFGSGMNPCIDCKILMLSKARELMPKLGAQFVVTGEVLGQRPMSQHRQALKTIEEKSALTGLLLRPLCAQRLLSTIPETEGWVDRERLFGISGRSRREQIRLAREFGLSGYPNASGGCLLTDPEFSVRLKDILSHGELDLRNIGLLKIGRHFRIGPGTKLIVGRNETENKKLEESALGGEYLFMPDEKTAGATCLGLGEFNQERIMLAARITCRYCDSGQSGLGIICRRIPGVEDASLHVFPLGDGQLAGLRV